MTKNTETHPELVPDECKIKRGLRFSIPFLVLAFIIPVLSLLSFMKPVGEDVSQWFQRSGSIMVVLSLWVEFNLYKISSTANIFQYLNGPEQRLSKKYKCKLGIIKYVGLTGAILGTVIWGYGDVLYEWIT